MGGLFAVHQMSLMRRRVDWRFSMPRLVRACILFRLLVLELEFLLLHGIPLGIGLLTRLLMMGLVVEDLGG